ncbi:cell envelope biogenesis protein OmpA [Kozakia baliensis]|uniref:Cell envelope biogenesis protein OmpA n=2 Tax=Kozakia baliensis TaxID=153496 RepID=A0A1D8UXA5_9PROT|nr:cell envelope biogenesis protein OmpA [Kozakia baliensis]
MGRLSVRRFDMSASTGKPTMRMALAATACLGMLSLAGCGDPYDPGARAGSGALIGAGGGAAIGALAGGGRGAAIGALTGGAVGAAGGAATTPNRRPNY